MNYLYGVRIKKSFESKENWYNINAYGGKQLAIWSILIIIAGLVCFLIPIKEPDRILLPFTNGSRTGNDLHCNSPDKNHGICKETIRVTNLPYQFLH